MATAAAVDYPSIGHGSGGGGGTQLEKELAVVRSKSQELLLKPFMPE